MYGDLQIPSYPSVFTSFEVAYDFYIHILLTKRVKGTSFWVSCSTHYATRLFLFASSVLVSDAYSTIGYRILICINK